MREITTLRGFRAINHEKYGKSEETRLIQESSMIDTESNHAYDNPGSSYLWVGADHHLNRKEVKQLIAHLRHWIKHKRLMGYDE